MEALSGSDYITDVTVQDSWTYALVGTVYSVHMESRPAVS